MQEVDNQDVVVRCRVVGLSAANRAAQLGPDVTLLEKSSKKKRGGHTKHSESFHVASTDAELEQYESEFDVDDYTPEDFDDDT